MAATLTASVFSPAPPTAAQPAGLRIAVVTPHLHSHGGTERATLELVTRLALNNEIHLFAREWEPISGLSLSFHPVFTLPGPGILRILSFYSNASRALGHAERTFGPFDLIYSPGPNSARVGLATAHFCQARHAEILRSRRHPLPAASFLDRLRHFNRRLYAATITRFERRFYRSPHLRRVLAPSRLLASDLIRYYGLSPERILVAPSGVNSEFFSPTRRLALRKEARTFLGLREYDFAFLFIGNSWLLKNLRTVLDAVAILPGATLLVVGGEDPHALRRYVCRLGIASRVRPLPLRADVLSYYAAADALVAPSLYETFGLVPLEAMACGLPAIVSRSMGVAEILGEDEAIVLDDPSNVAALAESMRRLIQDANFREALAVRGLARARRQSWDAAHNVTLDAALEIAGTELK